MQGTTSACMIMAEYDIRNAAGILNTPLEVWGCINSPIYHVDRFHTDKMDPNIAEK